MTESEKMKLGLWYDANYKTRNYQKNVRKPKIYISLSTILHQRKRRCGKIFLKNCFQKRVNVLPFSLHLYRLWL